MYKRRRQRAVWRNVTHPHAGEQEEDDLEQAIKSSDAVMSEAGSSRLGRLLLSTAVSVCGGPRVIMNPSEATPSQSSSDDDFSGGGFDGCGISVEPIIVPVDIDDYVESVEVDEGRRDLESGTAALVTTQVISDETKVAKEPPSTDVNVDEGILFIESTAADFYDGVRTEYVVPIRSLELTEDNMEAKDEVDGDSEVTAESTALLLMAILRVDATTEKVDDTKGNSKEEVEVEKSAVRAFNDGVDQDRKFDTKTPSAEETSQGDAENEVHLPPVPDDTHNNYDEVNKEWHLNTGVDGIDVERQASSAAFSGVFEDIDLAMQNYSEQEKVLRVVNQQGVDASDTFSDVFDDLQTHTGQEENMSAMVDRDRGDQDGVVASVSNSPADIFDDVDAAQEEDPNATFDRDPVYKYDVGASDTLSGVFDDLQTHAEQEVGPSSTVDRDSINQNAVDASDTASDVFNDLQNYIAQEDDTSAIVDRDLINQYDIDASISNSTDVFDDVDAAQEDQDLRTVGTREPIIKDGVDVSNTITDVSETVDAEIQTYNEPEEDASAVVERYSLNVDDVDVSVANLDGNTLLEVDASVLVEKGPISEMKVNAAQPMKELAIWPEVNDEPCADSLQRNELTFFQASPEYTILTGSPRKRSSNVSSEHSLCHSMSDDDDHQEFNLDESWDFNDNVDDSIGIVGDPFRTPTATPVDDKKPSLGPVLDTYKLHNVTARGGEKRRRSKSAPPRTKH